jgi:hypothetical protein
MNARSHQGVSVYVGLDVHKDSVDIALADAGRDSAVRHLVAVGRVLHGVYEAGPCGFVLQRHLATLGWHGEVVAPSSIPQRSEVPGKPDGLELGPVEHGNQSRTYERGSEQPGRQNALGINNCAPLQPRTRGHADQQCCAHKNQPVDAGALGNEAGQHKRCSQAQPPEYIGHGVLACEGGRRKRRANSSERCHGDNQARKDNPGKRDQKDDSAEQGRQAV